jgi:hypothetical protein
MNITHGRKLVLCGVIVAMAGGCSTMQTRNVAAAPPRSAAPISRVAVVWSEAVLRKDNIPVAQGFAGKLYLFSDAKTAVTAPGKFTIYAYDESDKTNDPEKAAHVKPDFTWELLESDLKDLLKKDAIGWSYSFWLPCGPPSPVERRYSVMVCFTPENAPRVISESTLVTLPAMRTDRNTALAQRQPQKPQNVLVSGDKEVESGF